RAQHSSQVANHTISALTHAACSSCGSGHFENALGITTVERQVETHGIGGRIVYALTLNELEERARNRTPHQRAARINKVALDPVSPEGRLTHTAGLGNLDGVLQRTRKAPLFLDHLLERGDRKS